MISIKYNDNEDDDNGNNNVINDYTIEIVKDMIVTPSLDWIRAQANCLQSKTKISF